MTERHPDFAELKARALAAGFTLQRVHDSEGTYYTASRWGMHKALPDLPAVARFLDRVGGRHERI